MKEFIKKTWNAVSFRHIKDHILLNSRGVKSQGRLSSLAAFHEFSPNITDLMKSNYSGVSKGKL